MSTYFVNIGISSFGLGVDDKPSMGSPVVLDTVVLVSVVDTVGTVPPAVVDTVVLVLVGSVSLGLGTDLSIVDFGIANDNISFDL